MTKTKHTPGPWEETSLDGWDAVKPVGINLAVCQLVENNPANAHLIAAAPEMLELLRDINYAFYVDGTSKVLKPIMARIKPLLQKARGEMPREQQP